MIYVIFQVLFNKANTKIGLEIKTLYEVVDDYLSSTTLALKSPD